MRHAYLPKVWDLSVKTLPPRCAGPAIGQGAHSLETGMIGTTGTGRTGGALGVRQGKRLRGSANRVGGAGDACAVPSS